MRPRVEIALISFGVFLAGLNFSIGMLHRISCSGLARCSLLGSDTVQNCIYRVIVFQVNAAMKGGSFLRSFSFLASLAFVTFKDAESFKFLSLEGEAANLTEHAVSHLSQHHDHADEEAEEEAEDEADNEGIQIKNSTGDQTNIDRA